MNANTLLTNSIHFLMGWLMHALITKLYPQVSEKEKFFLIILCLVIIDAIWIKWVIP